MKKTEGLAACLEKGEAALTTAPHERRYLTGFASSAGYVLTTAEAAYFRSAAADSPAAVSAAEAAVHVNLWIKKTKNRFFDTLYGLSCHSYCISLCDIV